MSPIVFFSPLIGREDGGSAEDVDNDASIGVSPIPEQPSSSSAVAPILEQPMNHNFNLDNLAELLALSNSGESVCWPVGLSADRVRQMLQH